MDCIDDLTDLSYLHEPGVLHTVRMRYSQQIIYTYSGIVLIAVNPFARVPLYSPEIAQAYSGKRKGDLDPHLFAVAEDAYRSLVRDNQNQSIIVSGESGAGKTISAKYIMRYFASVGDTVGDDPIDPSVAIGVGGTGGDGWDHRSVSHVEEQVLATNPIMEAFGNAKTTRNDNSSRFGKFIEIQFNQKTEIEGAVIRTYLLERSRVVSQPESERNYHIFYQLCAGVPSAEKKELALESFNEFQYLRQGGVGVIPGVDDATEFGHTVKALSVVGISVSVQWNIFRLLAAVLHLGNVSIESRGPDKSGIGDDDKSLGNAARLLGVQKKELQKWLIQKVIRARTETITTNMNAAQAVASRDAVSKYLYHSLFDWLVVQINSSFSSGATEAEVQARSGRFIGVLDIYGFEHFKKNSFEQFCINYANEKLQQEFNQHVFKLEQEEYVKEEIEWSFIDFYDNQPCIELIEGKLGILDLLDEESRVPSGSDTSLIEKLYQHFNTKKKHTMFGKPRFGNSKFTVHHYAHSVDYTIDGFLEKNKDSMPEEILDLLKSSANAFISDLFQAKEDTASQASVSARGGTLKSMRKSSPTLGSAFKISLSKLMDTINSTNAHYIRCIKPNEQKLPFTFDSAYVLQQLRACGVLETIRISTAGYPSRFVIQDFVDRYKLLVSDSVDVRSGSAHLARDLCYLILDRIIKVPDRYQIGISKVFLRAGQLAFLEKCRSDLLNNAATSIQRIVRGFIQNKRYRAIRSITLKIQTQARLYFARRRVVELRREKAAITIQRNIRGFLVRVKSGAVLQAICGIQACCRGIMVRRRVLFLKKNICATKIQKIFKGYLARRAYIRSLKNVVVVQALYRRRKARKLIKSMKAEARSIQKVQQKAGALEKKVFELTQLLAEKEETTARLNDQISELNVQIEAIRAKNEKFAKAKADIEKHSAQEIVGLRQENSLLSSENARLADAVGLSQKTLAERDTELVALKDSIIRLRDEVESAKMIAIENEKAAGDGKTRQLLAENADLKDKLSKLMKSKPKFERAISSSSNIVEGGYDGPASPVVGIPIVTDRLGAMLPIQETQNSKERTPPKHHRRHSSLESPRSFKNTNRSSLPEGVRKDSLELPGPELIIKTVSRVPPTELSKLFHDPLIDKEINELLILFLQIPPTLPPDVRNRREVLYPAHIIGLSAINSWRSGFTGRLKTILTNALKNIHHVIKYSENSVCAFWLSNLYELCSLMATAEKGAQASIDAKHSTKEYLETEKVISKFKADGEYLIMEIYFGWLKELKRSVLAFAISAVVEHQGLPGFIEDQTSVMSYQVGLISRLMGNTSPNGSTGVSIEKLLSWLTKLNTALVSYFVDDNIRRQILITLVRFIGTSAFNQILMRKNFCTWRRGMQIQYNVTRIEEWCTQNDIAEASLHMEPLMQATKLLQLNKATRDDLDIIMDVCFLLSPIQVKKLLSVYSGGEYDEHPVSTEILSAAAERCLDDRDNTLLMDTSDDSPFLVPQWHLVDHVDKYVPPYLASKITALKHVIQI